MRLLARSRYGPSKEIIHNRRKAASGQKGALSRSGVGRRRIFGNTLVSDIRLDAPERGVKLAVIRALGTGDNQRLADVARWLRAEVDCANCGPERRGKRETSELVGVGGVSMQQPKAVPGVERGELVDVKAAAHDGLPENEMLRGEAVRAGERSQGCPRRIPTSDIEPAPEASRSS